MQNDVVSVVLTVATNSHLTEPCIDKNWKLEDWNKKKKMWKLEGQFCIFTQNRKRKKEKKNKVLDFVKPEYCKEVLDFRNIEYHIVFLIPQIH